jgi:cytochrome c-type protein NapC
MDFDKQESRSSDRHEEAIDNGWTCIQCHKGIAHHLPEGYDPSDDTPSVDESEDEEKDE